MKVIRAEYFEAFRYAVAKKCFLEEYSRYLFVEDIFNTNRMIVKDREDNKKIEIALLSQKRLKPSKKQKIVLYLEKSQYTKSINKKKDTNIEYRALSEAYSVKLKKQFVEAILGHKSFWDNITKDAMEVFSKFSASEDEGIGLLYKHYERDKVINNGYGVRDGVITFSSPDKFNDPFDCNCTFANNISMNDKFRIFCTTPHYTNILMWSYYSKDHKGFCFEYDGDSIAEEILKIPGICFAGKVKYSKTRPKQRSNANTISYTEIKHYFDAAFTKFIDWKHEEEYRFVIISDDFSAFETSAGYLEIKTNVNGVYEGCNKQNGTGVGNLIIQGKTMTVPMLQQDSSRFKLI